VLSRTHDFSDYGLNLFFHWPTANRMLPYVTRDETFSVLHCSISRVRDGFLPRSCTRNLYVRSEHANITDWILEKVLAILWIWRIQLQRHPTFSSVKIPVFINQNSKLFPVLWISQTEEIFLYIISNFKNLDAENFGIKNESSDLLWILKPYIYSGTYNDQIECSIS
jgi:hypothetical protein